MSWGTCYAGSNNIHFEYPPLMSDGRNYTIWSPACVNNQQFIQASGIQSNYEYRQYLTKHADLVMADNRKNACDECGHCIQGYGNKNGMMNITKHLFRGVNDKSQPYGYENSDLKNMYLSRETLQSRLYAPTLSQYEYLVMRGYKQ